MKIFDTIWRSLACFAMSYIMQAILTYFVGVVLPNLFISGIWGRLAVLLVGLEFSFLTLLLCLGLYGSLLLIVAKGRRVSLTVGLLPFVFVFLRVPFTLYKIIRLSDMGFMDWVVLVCIAIGWVGTWLYFIVTTYIETENYSYRQSLFYKQSAPVAYESCDSEIETDAETKETDEVEKRWQNIAKKLNIRESNIGLYEQVFNRGFDRMISAWSVGDFSHDVWEEISDDDEWLRYCGHRMLEYQDWLHNLSAEEYDAAQNYSREVLDKFINDEWKKKNSNG